MIRDHINFPSFRVLVSVGIVVARECGLLSAVRGERRLSTQKGNASIQRNDEAPSNRWRGRWIEMYSWTSMSRYVSDSRITKSERNYTLYNAF
jgi:hypothetical protein